MEASFKSRVDETFGALFGPASDGITQFWSIRESTIANNNKESVGPTEVESGGSDGDEDDSTRYESFVKLSKRRSRRHQGEPLELGFFGEEDIEELDSEEGDEDDEEEERRHGKRKKRGEEEIIAEKPILKSMEKEEDEEVEGVQNVIVQEEEEHPEEEARQMRQLVGMDETLDFEEEEDEYDKVAVGREGYGDRLFMGHIKDFGASSLNPLPSSFSELRRANRDARANHRAALARLEEDDRQAASRVAKETSEALVESGMQMGEGAMGSGDASMDENLPIREDKEGDSMDIDGDGSRNEEPNTEGRDGTHHLASGTQETCRVSGGRRPKSGKRVRFTINEGADSDCKAGRIGEPEPSITCAPQKTEAMHVETIQQSSIPSRVVPPNRYSKVPDYVRHPSKYIHYTLDWSEEDEEQQNMAAFHAMKGGMTSSKASLPDRQEEPPGSVELPKISFNRLVSRGANGKDESSKRFSPKVLDMEAPSKGATERSVAPHQVPGSGLVNITGNFDPDSFQGGSGLQPEDDQVASPPSDKAVGAKPGRVSRRYRVKGERLEDN